MAGKKKAAAKKAPAAPKAAAPTAAAKEKDKEPPAATYRVDLGEALPAQTPFPTATDKHK